MSTIKTVLLVPLKEIGTISRFEREYNLDLLKVPQKNKIKSLEGSFLLKKELKITKIALSKRKKRITKGRV